MDELRIAFSDLLFQNFFCDQRLATTAKTHQENATSETVDDVDPAGTLLIL